MPGGGVGRKIPRTMATQHPDNACLCGWAGGEIIEGDAEVQEAYLAYKEFGCQEVMWDSEGKDVDTRVVRKLLSKYGEYFREHRLGEDVFLTYRIPNPRIEGAERKIVCETLQNIPVACDVASAFYGGEAVPIFEVILPFTKEGRELIWLRNYYEKCIAADGGVELNGAMRAEDWLGPFKPKSIEVIPLVEDFDSLLAIDGIVADYIKASRPRYLRAFIARSDPALNYGLFCAVILAKLAIWKLKALEGRTGVPIYPILGVGTMPFRGHLSPGNLDNFLREYRGLSTVTIQSALRYDYPIEEARGAVEALNKRLPNGDPDPIQVDPAVLSSLLMKLRSRYARIIENLAPLINSVASYVPRRRSRKLHIGLFGYSRSVGGISLPRAIPFACALYTIGAPPEVIGGRALEDLSDAELDALRGLYENLERDLEVAGGYLSWRNLGMLAEFHRDIAKRAGMSAEALRIAISGLLEDIEAIENFGVKLGQSGSAQRKYENFTNSFLLSYMEGEDSEAREFLLEAARLRRCLG
jgi:phosphoenolpyruvate carboxylase